MLKAYKYRVYPNNEQKMQIAKTFGCCRFVYNQTLAYKKDTYEQEKKSVSKTDCNNYCNRELKNTYEWLKEVDKFALTNAIYNMDSAYQKFFKEHTGYPKFKSKHDNHKSYTTNFTNGNIAIDFENGKIKLPKLKEVKEHSVICTDKTGKEIEIPCDSVIGSVGYLPNPLERKGKNIYLVGDCEQVGNLRSVVWGAYETAMKIC